MGDTTVDINVPRNGLVARNWDTNSNSLPTERNGIDRDICRVNYCTESAVPSIYRMEKQLVLLTIGI